MKIALYISLLFLSTSLFGQDVKKHLFDPDQILKQKSELDLTASQESTIKELIDQSSSNFTASNEQLKNAVEELNELLSMSQVNKPAAMSQLNKVITLEGQLKRAKLDMLIEVKNILTAEQQAKLQSLENVTFRIDGDDEQKKVEFRMSAHSKNAEPLYILKVNEIERMVKNVEDIDPNDIKAITVLKGEKAVDAYGSDGKNGVIIIELKD